MTKEEYLATQHQVMALAYLVVGLDLGEFLAWIERAESLGPIVDPTLFLAGIGTLTKIKRLARMERQFQLVAKDVLRQEPAPEEVDDAERAL